jgi:hypothetical protein
MWTVKLGIVRGLLVSCAVVAAVGLAPSAASADTASGADYGEHVTCAAQTMGFDGVHNPGMHTGYAGWGDMHDCPH